MRTTSLYWSLLILWSGEDIGSRKLPRDKIRKRKSRRRKRKKKLKISLITKNR
jgi:hypothetical protein